MLDFDMGAYAGYVWPAWGISALVVAALIGRTALAARRWRAEVKRLQPETNTPQAARSAAGRQE